MITYTYYNAVITAVTYIIPQSISRGTYSVTKRPWERG